MSTPLEKDPDNIDALITRVLAGLRDTQPSPGMDDRILHALHLHAVETQAEAPTPRRTPAIRLPMTIRTFAAAFTAASLLVAALLTLHPHRAPHTAAYLTQPQLTPATPAPAPTALVQPAPAQPPHTLRVAHSSPGAPSSPTALSSAKVGGISIPAARPSPATPPTDPEAAEALADTLAPSHPAPPLPLTPEEERLLRVLQRNNPIELAQLDPAQLETALARDQAEYRKFFTPPPPLPQDQPPNPTPVEVQAPTPAQIPPAPGDQQ